MTDDASRVIDAAVKRADAFLVAAAACTNLPAMRAHIERARAELASHLPADDARNRPATRGTAEHPCERCGNTRLGSRLWEGWYRCNACGYAGHPDDMKLDL